MVAMSPERATQLLALLHACTMPEQATEDSMCRWLWQHFRSHGWIAVPQVTVAMGDLGPTGDLLTLDSPDQFDLGDRRIDLLLARRAPNPDKSGPLETMAVEVKVTRADFFSDLRTPEKQAPWRSAATRHTYAVPAGLVSKDEAPTSSGLVWVHPPRFQGDLPRLEWLRRAPYVPRHAPSLPFRVVMAVLHRLSSFEGSTRGWTSAAGVTDDPQQLRAELTAARRALATLTRERDAARGKADSWRRAYALTGGEVACLYCERSLRPVYPKATGGFRGWVHVDRLQDAVCAELEEAQLLATARADYADASMPDREKRVRYVHRELGFVAEVEREPWRAFLPIEWVRGRGAPRPWPADSEPPLDSPA